jgi:hypothetical protein
MSCRRVALISALFLLALGVSVSPPAQAAVLSPTLTSVSPPQIIPGVNNQTVTLKGDFTSNSEVTFAPNTGITIVGAPVSSDGMSTLKVTVNVATDAPNTARDVTVTGGLLNGSSTCTKCITVGPAISSVSGPVSNSSSAATFTITGQAFKAPVSINITRAGYGFAAAESDQLLATNVNVVSPTSITATVNPFARAPGRWKVSISQDNGGKASFGDGITTGMQITGSKPTLASISPSRINTSQTDIPFALTGAGFAQGMTATVSGSGVTQTKKVTLPINPATQKPDTTKATLTLSANSSPTTGAQTLTLKNADGQSSTNFDAICVNCDLPTPGAPTISSVSPSILGRGANQVPMTVIGTNFGGPLPDVTVSPNGTGDTKIDIQVTRDSATKLTLLVSVGANTPTGARSLTVDNPGTGGSVTKDDAFTVSTDFNVTGVTPPGRPRGYSGNFAVNGSGFTGTPTVSVSPGTGITTGTPAVDSPAKLTVPVSVASDASTAPRDVLVTVGGVTKTCSGCFTVGLVPTVTSISPDAATGGGQASINALTGTNFAPGAGASLERSGQPSIGMLEAVVESPTKISGTFDLTNAAPGAWSVRVTNVDGGTAVLANAFDVILGIPSVTAVDPETITQATSSTLHLTGSAFAPGMAVTFPNADGVTVTEVTRTSNTTADVKVTASDGARLGSRDVKVTNTDGQSGTCTSCFVVIQGPQKRLFGDGVTAFENFNGGAFVAAGNIDNVPANGTEFVAAANAGGGPHVRPYRINPANGIISELGGGFFAYGPDFRGGVHVAVGNVDGNAANGDEIITGAGPGGGPHVRIWRVNNDLTISELFGGGFFAYGGDFRGGVWVAAGDVDGDGTDEIITGAGAGGGPHVKVFGLPDGSSNLTELNGWMAYDPAFAGGVAVGAGNLVPEGSQAPIFDEVATVPSLGGGAHVRVFRGNTTLVREFMAFDSADPNGYRITAGDFDFDTVDDLAVASNSTSYVHVVQIVEPPQHAVTMVSPDPQPLGAALSFGTNLAAADVDGDGDKDLVVSPDHNSAVTIRLARPLATT